MTVNLTLTHPDGTWNLKDHDIKSVPRELYPCIAKLHAYEKCGLSPDELGDLLDQLSKLRFDKQKLETECAELAQQNHTLNAKLADIFRFVEAVKMV